MNKNGYRLTAAIALLLFCNFAIAQTYSTGTETKKADVNMTELVNYYKEHPLPVERRMPMDEGEEEDRPKPPKPRPSEIHMMQRNESASRNTHNAYLPVSPAPVDTFVSTISSGSIIPPDTHGAVDSQYCITAINTEIHIQTRNGGNVANISLDAFWTPVLPHGTSTFDPRVHYDPFYKRWIMVTDAVAQVTISSATQDTGSAVLVAVSATNDPTGTWHMYAVKVDPTNAAWMDFPNVGFNSKWIMVTGNMFANTGAGIGGAVVYIFDYASIMAGTGAPFTKINQASPNFSIAPAITYDPTEPNLFALETWNTSSLKLWKISGPVGSPTMTSVGNPTAGSTQHWKSGPPGGGDFAPQVGGTGLVNIGDDRITRVMYRNHKLWCSFTAFLPSSGTATRSSIMWWQIDTNANPLQIGFIDDPTSHNFYAYSSIAVNAEDDAVIGFAAFSNTTHPSAAYALRMGTDPLDSIRSPNIFRHGQAYYYETFGGGRNRWGDYSGVCVDPRNDTDFWAIQESSIVGGTPNWDTWWASIQFCPKPIGPTLLSSPPSLCIGANGTYKINPIIGATTYLWTVSGTGWSSAASTSDSINVTIGSGTGTITVMAYNACGEGEASTFKITPQTVPNPFGISIITAPCVGSPTAVFSANSPGASFYNWQAVGTGWSGTGSSSSFTANVGTGPGMIICNSVNACGPSRPDTLTITPVVPPVTTFSVGTHATVINVNDVITFTGTAPAGSTYTWSYTGGIASPGTGPGPQTVYWTIAGTKTIILTVNNGGCTSTYSDTVNVGVNGVQQLNSGNADILIMPNPNDGSFNIVLNNTNNKNVAVTITDMQGRMVYTNDFGTINKSKLPIVAGNLIPGNYTVSINIDGTITTQKITVTR